MAAQVYGQAPPPRQAKNGSMSPPSSRPSEFMSPRPFLERPTTAYLFSPADAETERAADRAAKRTVPLSYGNRPGTNRRENPQQKPGDRYTTDSYRRAIERACKAADVPRWHPHQLRHNYATAVRKKFGVEAARVVLGHHSIDVTELYAERDAADVARAMG